LDSGTVSEEKVLSWNVVGWASVDKLERAAGRAGLSVVVGSKGWDDRLARGNASISSVEEWHGIAPADLTENIALDTWKTIDTADGL